MSSSLLVPPRAGERTARNQTVLDEETYTRGLSRIIERDFFPDLPRLRAHNAYVHALEEGDVDTIEACAHALVEAEAGDAEPCSMSIGEYQARYTTEDNASFAQLLEADAQRRRAKEAREAPTRPASSRRIEAPRREALPPAPQKRGMMPPPDVPPRAIRQDAPRIAAGFGALRTVHTQPQRRGRRDPGIQHAADRRLPLCSGHAARRPRAIDTHVTSLARLESGRADTAPAHESGRRRPVPQHAIDATVDADAQSCVAASLARYPILWSCRPSRPMRRTCRPDCGPDTPCVCCPHSAC